MPEIITEKPKRGIFVDELSEVEQMLWKGIQSRIRLERSHGVPIKDLYLRPEIFDVYEGIRHRCMDKVEAGVGYVFDGVHIHKGSIVQAGVFMVGTPWATTRKAVEKQRDSLGMKQKANVQI